MQRRDWKFQKTAVELAEAAQERCSYHMKRHSFWEEERDKAQAEINAAGVKVVSRPISGGERHDVVADPTLLDRLWECEKKMIDHSNRSNEYAQWYAALKTVDARTLELDHDDWLFFFGLRGDEDE